MKLFKKAILALMAVAVSAGFTACSDDDDYTPGGNQPGAYFAADAAKTVGVLAGENTFTVDIYRTDGSKGSYTLQANDPENMFEVPAQVVFPNDVHKTTLTIGVKGEMKEDTNYPLTITIVDGSEYGLIEYNFNVTIAKTVVTKNVGTGRYIFNGIYTGSQSKVPVTSWSTKENPEYVEWNIGDASTLLAGAYKYTITFANFEVNEDGVIPFRISPQYVMDDEDGDIMIADCQTFYEINGMNGSKFEGDSYFDPETGLLTIHAAYYLKGTTMWYGDKFEYMQLDGYPDYSVSVEYKGLYIDPDMTTQAVGLINTGKDVAKVAAAAVKTVDPEQALDYVLEGGKDVIEFEGGDDITQLFPTKGAGDYIIMVVTYDEKGEAAELDYAQFVINDGIEDPNLGWTGIGQADFADGWITGAFSRGGVQIVVTDEMFPVDIQQNDEQPTLFRMVEPWGSNYFISSLNAYPAKRNFMFWIEPDINFIAFEPQESGFGTDNWGGQLIVGDIMGLVASENPEVAHEDVSEYVYGKYKNEFLSVYEDGIITVPLPCIGAPNIGDGTFGYNWQNYQASEIYMPEVPESVKAQNKAKRVASPKFNSLHQTIRANRVVETKVRIPFKADFSKNNFARPTLRK